MLAPMSFNTFNAVDNSTPDCAEVKETLVAEIAKSALGRFLLDDLKRRGIELVLSNELSHDNQGEGDLGGYWDPAARRINLSARAPLHKLMHYFAHEVRHSAQYEADLVLENIPESLHPVNFVVMNRMREMDADAFAVYFVADHALETKSGHFTELSKPLPPLSDLETLFGAAVQQVDRSEMYRRFAETWREKDKNMALAMQAAAPALFTSPLVNECYDESYVRQWKNIIWPVFVEASKQPGEAKAHSLRNLFQRFRDGKFKQPADTLVAQAKAYSKIYASAGAPDYLEGVYDKIYPFLSEEANGAMRIWGSQMTDLKEKFNEACDYYLDKMPIAEKAKKPPNAARQAEPVVTAA